MNTLILGGMKSGKSRSAENLLLKSGRSRTVIATATAVDAEMEQRITRHKNERHPEIKTIEEPIYLADAIENCPANECILIDCLTLWITNLLMINDNYQTLEIQKMKFLEAMVTTSANLIMVSNESNMGIVPLGNFSRRYCDEIGLLHQEIANHCQQVILMVAGIPVFVKNA